MIEAVQEPEPRIDPWGALHRTVAPSSGTLRRSYGCLEPNAAPDVPYPSTRESIMKGIVAWLLGVPIIVIVFLYALNIF
jgi:hypothetical protein